VFRVSPWRLSETFFILRRTKRDIIENVYWSSRNVSVILCHFKETWISSTYFQKIHKYQISWKTVQWEQSRSMRMGGQTDTTKLFAVLWTRIKINLRQTDWFYFPTRFGPAGPYSERELINGTYYSYKTVKSPNHITCYTLSEQKIRRPYFYSLTGVNERTTQCAILNTTTVKYRIFQSTDMPSKTCITPIQTRTRLPPLSHTSKTNLQGPIWYDVRTRKSTFEQALMVRGFPNIDKANNTKDKHTK